MCLRRATTAWNSPETLRGGPCMAADVWGVGRIMLLLITLDDGFIHSKKHGLVTTAAVSAPLLTWHAAMRTVIGI